MLGRGINSEKQSLEARNLQRPGRVFAAVLPVELLRTIRHGQFHENLNEFHENDLFWNDTKLSHRQMKARLFSWSIEVNLKRGELSFGSRKENVPVESAQCLYICVYMFMYICIYIYIYIYIHIYI